MKLNLEPRVDRSDLRRRILAMKAGGSPVPFPAGMNPNTCATLLGRIKKATGRPLRCVESNNVRGLYLAVWPKNAKGRAK